MGSIAHASLVLDAFAHYGRGAGEVVTTNEILRLVRDRDWPPDDIDQGLEFCLRHGWVEPDDTGEIRLTASGQRQLPGARAD